MINKQDYGTVNFGQFKGKKWSDVPKHYLEYLVTDECLTPQCNKDISKKELLQRDVCEGQEELFDGLTMNPKGK